MAGNAVTLTFAGDATQLQKAADRAAAATQSVGDAARDAGQQIGRADAATAGYGSRLDRTADIAVGMSTAIGDAGGTISTLSDLQQLGANRAAEQAQALADVEQAGVDADQALGDLRQAQLDLNQSQLDAKQAGADAAQSLLDIEQAGIDAEQAQRDYNDAVKEHGKGSIEARQAALDLKQAQEDLRQAGIDGEQAQLDLKQAQEDAAQAGRDAAQANVDAKQAQLDLNEATRAADPTAMSVWGQNIELAASAALGLVGAANLLVMANQSVSLSAIKATAATVAGRTAALAGAAATGIATAAQWAWNVALTANPIGLVVVAIGALVAGIIWVATKTTWFQDLWSWTWSKIGDTVKGTWDWVQTTSSRAVDWLTGVPGRLQSAFSSVGRFISAPFIAGFNRVSDAWNGTVGRLSWTVPGWVPYVGGNSISAPKLPKFHTGGVVPGAPGEEVLALLQAGERITPAGRNGEPTVLVIQSSGSKLDDLLVELLRGAVKRRGGNVQVVLGRAAG
ncbi:hypothetical protein ACIBF5_32510 [Micromonospora sp. NPDC050417]|uniref:hypothetical protein n=1 Tax=Micromonospora sp. NPDC050417 TaxID=3364280 RepID=UPI0037AE1290